MSRSAPPDAFGRAAQEYELGRPDWPEALLERVIEPPVPAEADQLVEEAIERGGQPGAHRVKAGLWREPFAGSRFEGLREDHEERELPLTRDELIAYVLSISSIAAQPDAERQRLSVRLRELVPDCEYRRFVRTEAFWTRLR